MYKIKPNDKCYCNSDKKYKKCCMILDINKKNDEENKYINGQSTSSNKLKSLIEYYKKLFPKHKIIDITNYITIDNYKMYHIKNFNNKTIMLSEKTDINDIFFNEKTNQSNQNIILMYKGVYRAMNFTDILKYEDDIINVINSRDNQKNI
jgi:hypothetical protein